MSQHRACCCTVNVILPTVDHLGDHYKGEYLSQESANPPDGEHPSGWYEDPTDAEWEALYDATWAGYVGSPDQWLTETADCAFGYGATSIEYDLGHQFIWGHAEGRGAVGVFDTDPSTLGYDPDTEELYDVRCVIDYTVSKTFWASMPVALRLRDSSFGPALHDGMAQGTQKATTMASVSGRWSVDLSESDLNVVADGETSILFAPLLSSAPDYPGSSGSPLMGDPADVSLTVTDWWIEYRIRAKP